MPVIPKSFHFVREVEGKRSLTGLGKAAVAAATAPVVALGTFGAADALAGTPPQSSFSHPLFASQLPSQPEGTRVLTLNTASGAEKVFTNPMNRTRQAALVRATHADVAGFQEVDTANTRTQNVNTALEVARQVNPALDVFVTGAQAPVALADGTTVFPTPAGTLVEARSFGTVDRPGGVGGDTNPNASFGNAMYLSANMTLDQAYTLTLPGAAEGGPAVASPALLAALGSGPVTAQERAELAAVNNPARATVPSEPRSALVVRAHGKDGVERTYIDTHLTNGADPGHVDGPREAIRQAQLAFLGEEVQAESARPLVLIGDFNDSVANVGKVLEPAGMTRVVGGQKATISNYDEIWASAGTRTLDAAQVHTDFVTDHPEAGFAVLPAKS